MSMANGLYCSQCLPMILCLQAADTAAEHRGRRTTANGGEDSTQRGRGRLLPRVPAQRTQKPAQQRCATHSLCAFFGVFKAAQHRRR